MSMKCEVANTEVAKTRTSETYINCTVHDPGIVGLKHVKVELRARSPSVVVRLESKIFISNMLHSILHYILEVDKKSLWNRA